MKWSERGARRTLLAALEGEVRRALRRTQARARAWSHLPSDAADNALSDSTTRSGWRPVRSDALDHTGEHTDLCRVLVDIDRQIRLPRTGSPRAPPGRRRKTACSW